MEAGFRKMVTRDYKNFILLALLTLALFLGANATQNWRRLSKEEDLELDRQLKVINRPAIKSFRTKHGDILDCVEIYKQLAFDHPFLKNHIVQMKPKTVPEGLRDKASTKDTFLQFLPKNIKCPEGSVLIRRAKKADLIMEQYLKSLGLNYPTNLDWRSTSVDIGGHHFAVLRFGNKNYGAKAQINVWDPNVTADQFSIASMWIINGPKKQINSIQAGWGVNQYLYPNHSRLYTYWTADGYNKTGCFNILCPGFIQVSPNIPLGLPLYPVSTYGGPQYDIIISLYQDRSTGYWWLSIKDELVGYWPKALFTSLADGARSVSWGGEVYSPLAEASPSMGSGHFAGEGFGKSAYVTRFKVINVKGTAVDPDKEDTKIYADIPICYDAIYKDKIGYFFFGGPGRCIME